MSATLQLISLYKQLSPRAQSQLKQQLNHSPKMLALIALLDDARQDLQTQYAVQQLYRDELNTTPFDVLRNRFFKLRKKLVEDIRSIHEPETGPTLPLTKELEEARMLIYTGNLSSGIVTLEQLIEKLKATNIFELLPEAYRLMMYAYQAQTNLDKAERIMPEYKESIRLLADYQECQRLFAQALHDFRRGFEEVKKSIHQIKLIVDRHPKYVRFKLTYLSANMAHGSATAGNNPRALARYFNQYENLKAKHPDVPVGVYEPNYVALDKFKYLSSLANFEYLRQDFKAMYTHTVNFWKVIKETPQLQHKRSEQLYMNKVRMELALDMHLRAFETLKELKQFQKENGNQSNSILITIEEGRIYLYMYPVARPESLRNFIATLSRAIDQLTPGSNMMPKGDALGILAMLQFMDGQYKAAQKAYALPECSSFLAENGLDCLGDILALPSHTKPIEEAERLKKHLHQLKVSNPYMHMSRLYDRMIFLINHWEKSAQ